jgi:DNA-directed RNA polymerase II subunit RPB2
MNDEIIWNIINSHFKDNYQNLVMHHIDSFNDFYDNTIFNIIKEENPISLVSSYDEKIDEYRNVCEMYIGGKNGDKIYFGKPVLYENDESKYMYPNDSRLRNISYSMSIHYDVEVVFKKLLKTGEKIPIVGGEFENDSSNINMNIKKNIPDTEIEMTDGGAPSNKRKLKMNDLTAMQTAKIRDITQKSLTGDLQTYSIMLEKIYLGKFPIMLQSKYCILNNLPREVRSSMGECKNDAGGYFIIDGKEKTVVCQEKFADNMLYIREVNDDKYLYSAEMRCVSENLSKPIRTISIKLVAPSGNLTNLNIVVNVPQVKKPIPIFILFRALGIISDKEIIKYCLLDLEENKDYIDLFIPSIHDCGGIYTQKMALEFIATLTKWGTISYVWEVLNDYLFPHIGETLYKQKALFLGSIVKKLLKVYLKEEQPTDRDNYKFKRIELIGSLMNDLFKEYYKLQKKKIFVELDTVLSTNKGIFEDDLYGLVQLNYKQAFSHRLVEKGFNLGFKGNWGAESHTKRIGIVQDINRLSHNSLLSHLRKTNLPLDSTAKMVGPRLLNGSQFGYFDPVDTPDGGNIGLHKHLAISTYITKGVSKVPLIKWCLKNISLKLIEDCSFKELNDKTKVIINGAWTGMVENPIACIKKLKFFRRNALIPIYISITFNISNKTIYLYTDSGRICRPLFYAENEQLSIDDKSVLKIIEEKKFKYTDLVSGFNKKKDSEFHPNNYNFYDIDELYSLSPNEDIMKSKKFSQQKAVIEYIDSSEAEDSYIAIDHDTFKSKEKEYTHMEIHQSLILGVMGNLIIYPENNPGTRNQFSCGQSRQACSLYSTNHQCRMDKTAVVLNNTQIPIVKSRYMQYINNEENCYGENLIVAIMCYTGYNVEDAVLINEGSLKRGLLSTTYYSCYETHEEKSMENSLSEITFDNVETLDNVIGKKPGHDYSKLNKFGIINENEEVDEKTILIGVTSNNIENKDLRIDLSKKPKKGIKAYVEKSFISENDVGQRIAKVKLRELRIPSIGDKMASRAGQKGTIGLIVKEKDMPFTKSGLKPDMIVNPHAIPSRMTIGQLIETITGKLGIMHGGFIDSTAFIEKENKFNLFATQLVKHGFHSSGNDIFYNGMDGTQIESEVFMGPTYYMRLKHMVKDKINYRASGRNTNLTRQPVAGRANDGGLRIGEMERDVLISHGMSNFMYDSMMNRADKYYMAICNLTGMIAAYNEEKNVFYSLLSDGPMKFENITKFSCDMVQKTKFGRNFSIVKVPYSFKLLQQELGACNIQMRIITEDNINHFENMFYSKNINKLLKEDNIDLEDAVNKHLSNIGVKNFNKNNIKKMNANMIMRDNKLNEDDEEFRNNDFFIQFFEKFPDATMEEAKEDYKKFLDDGQSKLFISEELLNEGWTVQFSTRLNKKYWFNSKTGETSWSKPILKSDLLSNDDILDNDSPPWAPSLDSTEPEIIPIEKSDDSPDYPDLNSLGSMNTIENSMNSDPNELYEEDMVYFREDFKKSRIWKIKSISDKFITIYTDDNEGLSTEQQTRVVTAPDIYKVDDYQINDKLMLNEKESIIGGIGMKNKEEPTSNTPVVNIAPVFKIMNTGSENSDNIMMKDEDDQGKNVSFKSNPINNESSIFPNEIKDEPMEITDKSKIDFNQLVIKKVDK